MPTTNKCADSLFSTWSIPLSLPLSHTQWFTDTKPSPKQEKKRKRNPSPKSLARKEKKKESFPQKEPSPQQERKKTKFIPNQPSKKRKGSLSQKKPFCPTRKDKKNENSPQRAQQEKKRKGNLSTEKGVNKEFCTICSNTHNIYGSCTYIHPQRCHCPSWVLFFNLYIFCH